MASKVWMGAIPVLTARRLELYGIDEVLHVAPVDYRPYNAFPVTIVPTDLYERMVASLEEVWGDLMKMEEADYQDWWSEEYKARINALLAELEGET